MTFRQLLGNPKAVYKPNVGAWATPKKKLSLYKCYIWEPLAKGAPIRSADLDMIRARLALSEKLALQYAMNQLGAEKATDLIFNGMYDLQKVNRETFIVIIEIVFQSSALDEEVLLPIRPGDEVDDDPKYDPDDGLLTVTIGGRYEDIKVRNYHLDKITVTIEESGRLLIKDLKLEEVVIDSALTGGK